MFMRILFVFCLAIMVTTANAQSIAINNDGSAADGSAMLDVKSDTKGVLLPRMSSAQRNVIANPATGLLVFDINTTTLWFYSGLSWIELRGVGTPNFWLPHANGIYYNAGKVGIGIAPSNLYPLYVRQPNTGVGQAVAHFESDDVWHTSINLRNTTNNRQFSIVVGGTNNSELKPGNFGILNANTTRWAMIVGGTNNYVGFGSLTVNSPVPKSTVHVFTGDINIEQIGSGIIMKSPDGQCWRVTIDNSGNFVRTAITCP